MARQLLIWLFALVVACSGDGTTGPVGSAPPVALAPVASVTIQAATASLTIGNGLHLTVIVRDAVGNKLTNRTITFTSSNESIARVSTTGFVSALAPGDATITAISEGKAGQATITVSVPPVSRVDVVFDQASIAAGETGQLTATPRTAAGSAVLVPFCTIVFSSANEAIARVETVGTVGGPIGRVTGVAGGKVAITAAADCGAAGQAEGTAQITVRAPADPGDPCVGCWDYNTAWSRANE